MHLSDNSSNCTGVMVSQEYKRRQDGFHFQQCRATSCTLQTSGYRNQFGRVKISRTSRSTVNMWSRSGVGSSSLVVVVVAIVVVCSLSNVAAKPLDKEELYRQTKANLSEVSSSENFAGQELELFGATLKEKLKPTTQYLLKNYPFFLSGHDFEHRPLWIAEVGRFNLRSLVEEGEARMEEFRLHCKWVIKLTLESIRNATTEDWPVNQATVILDFDRLAILQLLHPQTLVYALGLLRQYSPLIDVFVHKVFIINANAVTQNALNMAKPILGGTFEKFEVFGTNKAKWISRFRSEFPKDALPSWYGGSKTHKPVKIFG